MGKTKATQRKYKLNDKEYIEVTFNVEKEVFKSFKKLADYFKGKHSKQHESFYCIRYLADDFANEIIKEWIHLRSGTSKRALINKLLIESGNKPAFK